MNSLIKSPWIFFIEICVVLLLSLGVLAAVNSSPTHAAPPAQGPLSGNSLWRDVKETALRSQGTRLIIPDKYRLLAADMAALDNLLGQAPLESSRPAQSIEVVLTLPLPDGNFGRFRIEESPIMEPALAVKYPEIKTYRGWGLDDLTATAYLDRTPAGFHGMILSSSDTVYIDPYQRNDITNYLSYFKQDYGNFWKKSFQEEPPGSSRSQGVSVAASAGPTLHTYRLAMAATGEYTQFQGGTVAAALAAINTTMNRVNGLYQRDLSIRMILVANTDQIIYTNGATDPYSNNNGGAMLNQNQNNVNAVIGSANYDIGHVFSTGGGGIASLESVCFNPFKAQGVTGSPTPVGDPFDIDFVAHEMGHQFGANHTFNAGNIGSCTSGTRNGPTAYEPGSGTTIMSYAGICGGQDLQPHSDDNFHVISFDEITAYVTDPTPGFGGSCGSHTATGNSAPIVNAGVNDTIPINTPFSLTGSASDPNNDPLSYQWEEFDRGNAWLIPGTLPNTDSDGSARPIFRSYKPGSSSARIFPALVNILDGSLFNNGESLPSINRTMTFRLTVRDNKGGVNNASLNVTVSNTSGPFRVTAPVTGTTWLSATQQTVSWNVANTIAAPVNCAAVNILFSSNDGNNFYTLLANTPNNGTATITTPIFGTNSGRVMVQCNGNIFFHISGRVTLIGNTPLETYLPAIVKNN